MSHTWCSPLADGVRLAVQVAPNAKKSAVMALLDDAIKIRLQAPPLDGRANEELIRFLAQILNLPKSALHITHGQTNKRKLLAIKAPGVTVAEVQGCLLALVEGSE